MLKIKNNLYIEDTIHKMDIVNLMERFKEYNPWIF